MGTAWFATRPVAARIEPPCPVYRTCGGCQLQDVAYPDQILLKREHLRRLITPLAPTLDVDVMPSEEPWRYRNKAELSFGQDSGRLILGYHAAGSFARIVDLDDCLLLPEPMMAVAREARRLAARTQLAAYEQRTHAGFFRHLVLRSNRAGQVLVVLVTAQGERAPVQAIADELMASQPSVAGVSWGVSQRVADVALPEQLIPLGGRGALEERIGPFALRIQPLTFLQPNLRQAEQFYTTLAGWARGSVSGCAWDLYCGIGVVGLYLHERYRTIYGIESVPESVALARANAEANGVRNLEFHLGAAEAVLASRRFWLLEAKPELVVVDPPRAGLQPSVVAAILSARPQQIIYVSCNPDSLARDLEPLLRGFPRYRLARVMGFDCFPQTRHLEALALLER